MVAWAECRATRGYHAVVRCRELLRQAGSTAFEVDLITNIPVTAIFSGRPLDEVASLVAELERETVDRGPLVAAGLRVARARCDFHAGLISPDEARAGALAYAELLRQVGSSLEAEISLSFLGPVALVEGTEAWERAVRERVERFEGLGDRMYLANALAEWAASLCAVGDAERAREAVARGRTLARPDDRADSIALDVSEAYVAALLGDRERAEHLLDRADAALAEIDMALFADWSRYVESGVRSALGDTGTARAILERLAESADLRGFVRLAGVYRRELEALGAPSRD